MGKEKGRMMGMEEKEGRKDDGNGRKGRKDDGNGIDTQLPGILVLDAFKSIRNNILSSKLMILDLKKKDYFYQMFVHK